MTALGGSHCTGIGMDYRGPACLAIVWYGSSPTPSVLPYSPRLRKRDNLLTGEGGKGGGRGAESYDHKKTWSSINLYKLYGWVWINLMDEMMHVCLIWVWESNNNLIVVAQIFSPFEIGHYSVSLLSRFSTALPWDFYFFKLTQPLTVSVKEKGGKPDRKPYPLPYGLSNPYRNL